MTLEHFQDNTGSYYVRLIECPFCGTEIGRSTPRHLRKCAAFYRAFDVEVPERAREFSPASGQDPQPERAT